MSCPHHPWGPGWADVAPPAAGTCRAVSRTDWGGGGGRLAQCLAFEALLAGAGLSSCFRKELLVPRRRQRCPGPSRLLFASLLGALQVLCREVPEKPLGHVT